MLEPSWTAPCTGMSEATGTNRPISASMAMPPPMPKTAVSAEVKALASTSGKTLNWANLGAKSTQDWTTHHVIFNSQDQSEVSLFFGEWGASRGDLWWDDAKIELAPFVNLLRRDGCPLKVTTAEGKELVEGKDFERLRDPLMGTKPYGGEYDVYHAPPADVETRSNRCLIRSTR